MKTTTRSLLVFSMILLLFTACAGTPAAEPPAPSPEPMTTKPGQEDPAPETSEIADEAFLAELAGLVPPTPSHEDIEALTSALEGALDSLSPEAVSQSLHLIKSVQDQALENHPAYGGVSPHLAEALFDSGNLSAVLADPSLLENPTLEEEVLAYQKNYFTIATAEGMYYLMVDFHRYLTFEEQVTPETLTYLEIMAEELDHPTFRDAAMVIDLDTLWKRVLAVDAYLADRPSNEDIRLYYQTLLYALIYGGNNTPVYDYTTETMTPDRIAFYDTRSLPENSPLFEAFEAFKEAAKASDYRYSEPVESSRTRIMVTFESSY
jgi:hypothetical protein